MPLLPHYIITYAFFWHRPILSLAQTKYRLAYYYCLFNCFMRRSITYEYQALFSRVTANAHFASNHIE